MEDTLIDKVILNSSKQQKWIERIKTKRYLYDDIQKIDKEYYVGVKGIRGV